MEAIEHLSECQWGRPEYYAGFNPVGDYLIYTRNRDDKVAVDTNYRRILEDLQKIAETLPEAPERDDIESGDCPWVYEWRASHWGVGWVEYIMVRQDAPESLLKEAGEIVCALACYPLYDEMAVSEAEFDACCEYWEHASVADRVEMCQHAGISIFAARRDDLPSDDGGYIQEYINP